MAIVTISRGSMSGGEAFAKCLASNLGYPVLGREVLVEAAARLGVPESLLREKIQTSSGLFEKLTTDRHVYLVALQSALADQCVSGDLIYHGNAGHFLLRDVPNILRVRLIAPMAMRVHSVMRQQGLSPEAAQDYIRYVDQERIEWTKFIYGVDWRDPRNYDLIINLKRVSFKSACTMVSGVVRSSAYATTAESKKKLKDFALACRVKATLVARPKWRRAQFEVCVDSGKVEIFWQCSPESPAKTVQTGEQQEIRQTTKTVEGVEQVELHFKDSSSSGRAA